MSTTLSSASAAEIPSAPPVGSGVLGNPGSSCTAEGTTEKPKKKRRKPKVCNFTETTVDSAHGDRIYHHQVTRNLLAPTRVRGYVVRAYPTVGQCRKIGRLIGQGRYLYNWILATQNEHYAQGESLHTKEGKAKLNRLITEKLIQAREDARKVVLHPGDPTQWGEHWLAECPRTLITRKLEDLNAAWVRYFKHQGGKPKFQRKSASDSFRVQIDPRQYEQSVSVHFEQEKQPASHEIWVKIPNVGRVRVALHEPIHGRITTITVRRRSHKSIRKELYDNPQKQDCIPADWAGYEITLTAVEVPIERDKPKNWANRVDWEADALMNQGPGLLGCGLGELDPAGVVALDMSVIDRAVTSGGDSLGRRDTDPYTKKATELTQARIKRDQRKVARQNRHRQREADFGLSRDHPDYKGGSHQPNPIPKRDTWTAEQKKLMKPSKRQQKVSARVKVNQGHLANQRAHDAHVFTTFLVLLFHTIVVESLTLTGMAQSLSRGFRRAFTQASMGQILTMLAYKCQLYGRTLVVADRWFPSSKQCTCGLVNKKLTLSDRVWTCPGCGRAHERDLHATDMLKTEACTVRGIQHPGGGRGNPSCFTAGESPGAGRRGLEHWIGTNTPVPRSTPADEASNHCRNEAIPTTTVGNAEGGR